MKKKLTEPVRNILGHLPLRPAIRARLVVDIIPRDNALVTGSARLTDCEDETAFEGRL